MSNQPDWKCIANLGDRSPIEYGGYFVYVDQTGVYPPEAEWLEAPEDDDTGIPWELYRFILEPCTYVAGVLSDNRFHPDHPVWFQDELWAVANTIDSTAEILISQFCSADPLKRAEAWRAIGQHYGFYELDSSPRRFSHRFKVELFARHRRPEWADLK